MVERGCSYDAARVWVGRRRAQGLSDGKIIEEAGASNAVDEDEDLVEGLRAEFGLS